jgi:hypothetical protein
MRLLTGTWLNPSAFFALWWCGAGILPLIATPSDPVSPGAMLWLIAASIAVSAGAAVGNGGFKTKLDINRPFPSQFELRTLKNLMIISLIAGLGSNVAFALASGVSLRDLLDVQQLVIVSNQLYVAKYASPDVIQPDPPLLSQALLPFVFLAPALGGIVFVLSRRKLAKTLALLTLTPVVAVTVLQNTKAAVLFGGILWASAYFATRLRLGRIAVFTRAHVTIAAVVGSIVTVFFFFVGLARLASTDTGLLDVVRDKLFSSAFGHMTAFSQWLTEYWNQSDFSPTLGGYTLSGPLELLHIQQRLPGIFVDLVELAIGETSNVYTGFRFLIQDFTIPGALAVLGLVGLVGGISFRLVASGRWAAVPILIGTYATIMWTPVAWIWVYNSLTATIVGLVILLFVFRHLKISRALMAPVLRKMQKAGTDQATIVRRSEV